MDEVPVLVSDLEAIRATLNACHKQNEAWDIFDNYRKFNNRFAWSPITRDIDEKLAKVEALIESAKEEE